VFELSLNFAGGQESDGEVARELLRDDVLMVHLAGAKRQ
jgi:hypothetical protein